MGIKAGNWSWRSRALCALGAAAVLAPLPALAQESVTAGAPAPSESAMVNLVRALVAQGALKAEVGDQLIRQAEAEALQARAANRAAAGDLPAAPAGSIRVPYIPETVRAQIKDELRNEVMASAQTNGWAAPGQAAPDWTRRITLHGDVRFRSESALYSKTNADDIIDFGTLNALSPYDIDNPFAIFPILNSRRNVTNDMRLRARLGIDVDVAKGVTAGIAVATGENQGPISTNQTLAGGFLKRDIWLDKAWLRLAPTDWASGTFGRFANPFRSSDLLYDPDLNFDGVAFEVNSGRYLGEGLKLSLRGGAFPYDFGNPNAPTFEFDKPRTAKRYLFAGEAEFSGKVSGVDFSVSAGYHDFHNFQGQLSSPCFVETDTYCSTDHYQPVFLTKGNTLSPLRQIVTVDTNSVRPQLLGYTFDFKVLDLNATASVPINENMDLRLAGSFVKNLGFKKSDICRNAPIAVPYNNNEPTRPGEPLKTYCAADPAQRAEFAGGDTGYRFEARLGRFDPFLQGEWNVFAGYRYLESDAVLDALTDSDFHLEGTNTKGYFLGANYALRKGVTIGGRWLSANEIGGPPLAIDVLQLDLGVRF